jgi:hypothetical protein
MKKLFFLIIALTCLLNANSRAQNQNEKKYSVETCSSLDIYKNKKIF